MSLAFTASFGGPFCSLFVVSNKSLIDKSQTTEFARDRGALGNSGFHPGT